MIICGITTPKGVFSNYAIDEYGRIYNTDTKKQLAPTYNSNGYAIAKLCKKGKVYYFKVHRLVLINILGYDRPDLDCNHIDGNKKNNHISNLEWATRSENIKHAYAHGLNHPSPMRGSKNGNSKYDEETIRKVIKDIFIRGKTAIEASNKRGVSYSTVKAIKARRQWVELIDEVLNS